VHELTDYLLYVSVLSPQKNLAAVVRTFAALDRPTMQLAIAGKQDGPYFSDVIEPLIAELGIGHQVRKLGIVPTEQLPGLYAGARAFLYPSYAEGFGLPPLEAMASGIPVIASDRSSLPEVLGDAAVLVDPDSITALAEAVERMLDDTSLRLDLATRGRARARRFQWAAAAQQALDIYAAVA
jgi:glycosyltransferase involved in cell wall biosynthesis